MWQAVTRAARDHEEQHGDGQHGIGAGGEEGDARGLGLGGVIGRDDTQHLFLIGPDQHPHVKEHNRAEPGTDADGSGRALEHEGVAEADAGALEVVGAQDPGRERGPAEPKQRLRRDVLGDASGGVIRLGPAAWIRPDLSALQIPGGEQAPGNLRGMRQR